MYYIVYFYIINPSLGHSIYYLLLKLQEMSNFINLVLLFTGFEMLVLLVLIYKNNWMLIDRSTPSVIYYTITVQF